MRKIRSIIITIFTVCIILIISGAVIAYGRGYRFDFGQKSIAIGSTGLISVTSSPTGAQIFIDGKNYGATNTNVTIKPGWYTVTIAKEGYQSWEKHIRIQGEVVARADATLFPKNPSLSAITTSGIISPVVSPDGSKIVYTIDTVNESTNAAQLTNKNGTWVLELIDKPLGMNRDARQILKPEILNTKNATMTWSPDSKQILVDIPTAKGNVASYLVDGDKLNDIPKPISDRQGTIDDWKVQERVKEKEKLSTLTPDFITVATSSMRIIAFSPDEQKILYEATASATIPIIIDPPLIGTNPTEDIRTIKPSIIYTYDIKEDRNYVIGDAKQLTLQWLPSSHLLTISKDKIEIMDFDGTNRKTVYAGPFWDTFVAPWTNANRVVILTNLNPTASTLPNLYAINIQ